MKKEHTSKSPEETGRIAQSFGQNLCGGDVVCMYGDLGAGKTTFCQALFSSLGAKGPFTSPTFVIIKAYEVNHERFDRIYHIDAYRVGSRDVIELGWDDMIKDDRSIVVVEWPSKITSILPENTISVRLDHLFDDIDSSSRKITIEK